jgi:hypothetical protein
VIVIETIDLFGETVKTEVRKTPAPKGYAAQPGSGPRGEKCGSCRHAIGTGHNTARTYYKCELLRPYWTSGYGTDILLKAPACRFWANQEAA